MEKDKIALLDFGCVKSYDETYLSHFNDLHLALISQEEDAVLVDHYVKLGMIDEDEKEKMITFYREVIKPLDTLYIEIFLPNSYDFKSNRGFSKRGFEKVIEVQKKQFHSVHKYNPEYLFINRTLLGYYALFEQLEATVSTHYVKHLMQGYKKGDFHANACDF